MTGYDTTPTRTQVCVFMCNCLRLWLVFDPSSITKYPTIHYFFLDNMGLPPLLLTAFLYNPQQEVTTLIIEAHGIQAMTSHHASLIIGNSIKINDVIFIGFFFFFWEKLNTGPISYRYLSPHPNWFESLSCHPQIWKIQHYPSLSPRIR